MSYVIVLVATTLGVLGVLFSRRNQFKILSPASQILLWLIVLAGIAAVVDTAYKDDAINAANKRIRQGDERLQSLAAKPFDLAKPPVAAKFVIEFDTTGGQPATIENFTGPFPSYGRTGRLGTISVSLADTFTAHAEMTIDGDRLRFTQTDADGRALREGEAGPWFVTGTGPQPIYGVELRPQVPLARIFSAIKANGAGPLGAVAFDIPNTPQTRTFVALNFEKVVPAFKFQVRQETPYQPCLATMTVPLRFEIDPPRSDSRMTATLRLVERETLSIDCGKS